MTQSISLSSQNKYAIKVYGQLDESWLGWFGEAKTHVDLLADNNQVTTFSDVVMDQAGLACIIGNFHGNLLRAVRVVRADESEMKAFSVNKRPPSFWLGGLFISTYLLVYVPTH